MPWFREYPRSALFAGAVILVLVGSFVVARKSPVETTSLFSTESTGSISDASFSDYAAHPTEKIIARPISASLMQTVVSNPPFVYSYPFIVRDNKTDFVVVPLNTSPAESKKAPEVTSDAGFWNQYSFMPRGLISTSVTTKTRTPEENALFDYGNELGSYIGDFESAHTDMLKTLTDFFPRSGGFATDGRAREAVLELAGDYAQLGETIARTSAVPKEAQALHIALANGYGDIGRGLAAIANTKEEKEMVKAIIAYGDYANGFVKNFLALADFFGARGVKFSSSDPGNVFSLNIPGAL